MKIAVVVGGWHWPKRFYEMMPQALEGADLFVIAHRSPELPIVREEKQERLAAGIGRLAAWDRSLYYQFPTVDQLRALGWNYREAPNTMGDWAFFNQWLDQHDFSPYDWILNCHDDTLLRKEFDDIAFPTEILLITNGTYPTAPPAYCRGSFEFWNSELLRMLGGRINLGDIALTREGQTDSPDEFGALAKWNDQTIPLREFLVSQKAEHRVRTLSPYYRISPWVVEGERGFLNSRVGAPWSFDEGLKAFPL